MGRVRLAAPLHALIVTDEFHLMRLTNRPNWPATSCLKHTNCRDPFVHISPKAVWKLLPVRLAGYGLRVTLNAGNLRAFQFPAGRLTREPTATSWRPAHTACRRGDGVGVT